jgi:hypothetical protein
LPEGHVEGSGAEASESSRETLRSTQGFAYNVNEPSLSSGRSEEAAGQTVQTYGTACLQPDGTWRIVE